jgi:IclR family transcriptional regulator, pca regulon regulatory protein
VAATLKSDTKRASSPAPAADVKSTVLSLAKGLRVLESFTAREPEQTLSQIAAKAGLDPGTAFRVVKTFVTLGYLRQIDGAKRYRLAMKVLDLGFHALSGMDLDESSRPILRSLVGEVSEAASLSVLEGADVVYIERVQAGWMRLGVNVRVGSRIPAFCTAAGHAILAHLPPERRLEVLRMRERVKLTPRTLVTISEIERRLARVRQRGYALNDQETVPGLRVMAAPVLDPDGHPYGAVSVAAPSMAGTVDDFVATSAGPLGRAALELSRILRVSGAASAA